MLHDIFLLIKNEEKGTREKYEKISTRMSERNIHNNFIVLNHHYHQLSVFTSNVKMDKRVDCRINRKNDEYKEEEEKRKKITKNIIM